MSPGPDDRREGGFVVIHRRIKSWPLYRHLTGEQKAVVFTLILEANWKPGSFWYGKSQIFVGRGELALAEETIAREAGTTRKVVRTVLGKLEAEGFLSRKKVHESGQCPAVITIKNYDEYQTVEEKGARGGPEVGPDRTKGTRGTKKPLAKTAKPQDPIPSDTRGEGRVIRLNPDDCLTEWSDELQQHVPKGLTAAGRDRLRRG
jgi:hypothetical protein